MISIDQTDECLTDFSKRDYPVLLEGTIFFTLLKKGV